MKEFLIDHPTIRLDLFYLSDIDSYVINVFSQKVVDGKRPILHIVISRTEIESSKLPFEEMVGVRLEEWWNLLSPETRRKYTYGSYVSTLRNPPMYISN